MIAPNAMRRHHTENVTEAIALASQLKLEGTYDWFRGQIGSWPMKSSRARLKPNNEQEEMRRLERFVEWVHATPGLESLSSNLDFALAVAQHYGLPTNFVDFSTEPKVAGFFASHGRQRRGMESCILCLNTDDLREFWKILPAHYEAPEFLKLDVPNLWRVEAQSGTFLYCPHPNFENVFYDLDRIVFPYTGPIAEPTVHDIYPARKSNLELLLDQFFMNEVLITGQKFLESMPVPVRVFHAENSEFDSELVIGEGPKPHPSWDVVKRKLWLTPTVETVSSAATDEEWEFENIDGPPTFTAALVRNEVARRLDVAPLSRSKLISWQFKFRKGSMKRVRAKVLSEAVQRLWDGLRTLPYTSEDLATGIGNCVALYVTHLLFAPSVYDPRRIESSSVLGGDTLEVEFGARDGSYSRAYASQSSLRQAVRHDIGDYLTPDYRERLLTNMTGLLQAVYTPSRLFDFDRLAIVFAREIAPSQVLSRFAGDEKRHSNPIFFSPARLDKFGLP